MGTAERPLVPETDAITPRYRSEVTSAGHLLCWGCGEFGQHGHGYRKEVAFLDGGVKMFCDAPETIVKHMACGASHTAVVTTSDKLYLWGNGNSGQLGCKNVTSRMEPSHACLYQNQEPVDVRPSIAGVACGGRHTAVWLENGHVFVFGNNSNAQLGYDFREHNRKENQTQPMLLRSLQHKPVAQVACGDKHSIFLFKDATVACVGSNSHGQLGTGSRDDGNTPRTLSKQLNKPVTLVAAGSNHCLAVTECGSVYVWGYGKACGSRTQDVLEPQKMTTHRNNILAAAGGSSHSMCLSANGSVYTWGSGTDGQLGHGERVRFLSHPRRIKDRHVVSRCIQISCGEAYSAAVTEKGLLYMWGKNSHTILPDKPTTHKVFLPHGVNKNFRGGRIARVFCGSWHALAQIGRPELLIREENAESVDSCEEPLNAETDELGLELSDSDTDEEMFSHVTRRETSHVTGRGTSRLEREKTTVSLADFYAPTPDPKTLRSPSPEFFYPHHDEEDLDRINSTRSAATLIVQLPLQPMTSYADAATSPMTLTTTSSTKSSSISTLSRVPSPITELPHNKIEKLHRKLNRPEKKFHEFDPMKYEREKLRSNKSPVSEVVQLSKSSADSFTLPREPTGLSKKHVDFSEMEEIRLKGPKSPEKLSRLSRRRERREPSPNKFRELSPSKLKETLRELNSSRSRHRYLDSSLSYKSDSALMESPLFRGGGRAGSQQDSSIRRPWETPVSQLDDRQYKHHVPRHHPRKFNNSKTTNQLSDSNFGLQISRSQTIVAPVQGDGAEPADRLSQLRRYAAIHNPPTNIKPPPEKLRPIKHRHVSIPGGKSESPIDPENKLCIGAPALPKEKPTFSSGTSWKDRNDFDRLATRKMPAAGIVKMYIANNELVSTVESPLYTTLSDGRGHSDSIMDSDSLMVQPLLKTKLRKPEKPIVGVELPAISISQSPCGNTNAIATARLANNRHYQTEEFDAVLVGNSASRELSREPVMGSRVS